MKKENFDFMARKGARKVSGKRGELYAAFDLLVENNQSTVAAYFEQYKNGLITLGEFSARCEKLAKDEKAAIMKAVNYKK